MNTKKPNIGLLVHACDRYKLLYPGFAYFFHRNWDFSAAATLYFATEEISTELDGFKPVQSGEGAWADRLKRLLKQKISEEYVFYLQEDMWLDQPVSGGFLNQVFDYATAHEIDCLKLHSSGVYQTVSTGIEFQGFALGLLDNKRSDFLMSHQITLWRKAFLIEQLRENEHPWRNERKATKRMKKRNPDIFQIDYFSVNGSAAVNLNKPFAQRSGYRTVSENAMLGDQYGQIAKTIVHDPAMSGYFSKLNHHYRNRITHDGRPQPRKSDIFKKLKTCVFDK